MNNNDITKYDGIEMQSKDIPAPPIAEGQPINDAPKKSKTGVIVGAGIAGAVLLGAGTAFAINRLTGGDDDASSDATDVQADNLIPQASSVNDDMSFNEAFAAARAEVGPGGCFVWHGNVYGTYTSAEWNAMTPAEQAEFTHHAMGDTDYHAPATAHTTTVHNEVHVETHHDVAATTHAQHSRSHQSDYDNNNHNSSRPVNTDVTNDNDDAVHIISVEHVDYQGQPVTVAYFEQYGHRGMLVDIDNDGVFDHAVFDQNDDGTIDDQEIAEIPHTGNNAITVDMAQQYAENQDDIPDYVNDAESDLTSDTMVDDTTGDDELHVIGVNDVKTHDGAAMTVGLMESGGNNAMLVDVDHDGTFDVMLVDTDGDGEISDSEILELDHPIPVDDITTMVEIGDGGEAEASAATFDNENDFGQGVDDTYVVEASDTNNNDFDVVVDTDVDTSFADTANSDYVEADEAYGVEAISVADTEAVDTADVIEMEQDLVDYDNTGYDNYSDPSDPGFDGYDNYNDEIIEV